MKFLLTFKKQEIPIEEPTEEEKETLYGFYSANAQKIWGSTLWETKDGTPVEITHIYVKEEGHCSDWTDEIFVAEVIKKIP